jgi:predicted nucleic acid-binding Zn ribbon protein
MNGLCDVKGCSEPTFVAWRPLTESQRRQICKQHWRRHLGEKDSFDLYEAFKFRRPARKTRRPIQTETRRCGCGRAIQAGHRFCSVCIQDRERQRKRLSCHKRKNPEPELERTMQDNMPRCRVCGNPHEPGHTYCSKCSKERRQQGNRERQRRHYQKMVKCGGLT